MPSDSTSNLVTTIVDRLKTYTDVNGYSVNALTGGRIFVNQAPDNSAAPYVVVRKGNTETDPDYGNLRQGFDLEANCYGRPRGGEQDVELIADLVEGALLSWREASAANGLSFCEFTDRETMPPPLDPVDREFVQVVVLARIASWAKYNINALT